MNSQRLLTVVTAALALGLTAPGPPFQDAPRLPAHGVAGQPVQVPLPSPNPKLRVNVVVVPANDPGLFNIRIDNVPEAVRVHDGGSTGWITVPPGTHTVTEVAGTGSGTNLALYTITFGGSCGANGGVHLTLLQNKTCTVTNVKKPPFAHGSWTRGPGTHTFSVCAYGTTPQCDLTAMAGQSVPITIEVWGGGGGGGGGAGQQGLPGNGGGGGGGGGYAKTTVAVVIPAGGVFSYDVIVGIGGVGGATAGASDDLSGEFGGMSVVELPTGDPVTATGGHGGMTGYPAQFTSASAGAGVGGDGNYDHWSGSHGYQGGYAGKCVGGGVGLGGAGGGPGRTGPGYINDGGDGGHGGYSRQRLHCNAESTNNNHTGGKRGGNGRVTITW